MHPVSPDTFAIRLLDKLELVPTAERIAFLVEWMRHEGTGARFNPLATTQPGGEYEPDPFWNTFGPNGEYHVRNYDSLDAGIEATAATLNNGRYGAVLTSLAALGVHPEASRQIRVWGTTSFADQLDAGWTPFPRSVTLSDLDSYEILSATGVIEWYEAGNIRLKPTIAALQDKLARLELDLAQLRAAIVRACTVNFS